MKNIGIILILLAVVLFVANWYFERRRKEQGGEAQPERRGRRRAPVRVDEPDFTRPRPAVDSFHVEGERALVTFDVPFPDDGDDVLADLLVSEAMEVVREKRHSLPIDSVTEVVVFAGRENRQRVGSTSLTTPGVLPPPSRITDILNLHSIGKDPLAAEFEGEPTTPPGTVAPTSSDELAPISEVVRLPKAVATGLRTQGIDPDSMGASAMVTGVLSLFGYTVTPGIAEGQYTAAKGGATTFILADDYTEGDYPEVEDAAIRRFVVAFEQSGADRGMFVSDKFAPFSIHELERRNPRIRFVTRERLQKMIDSMSLG